MHSSISGKQIPSRESTFWRLKLKAKLVGVNASTENSKKKMTKQEKAKYSKGMRIVWDAFLQGQNDL